MFKNILIGICVVLLIVVGVVAYLIFTLDPEELGQKLLQSINEKGGIQIQAESFQISPFKGLYIESAHAEGELASGSMTADIGRVVVDYQLLPILQGEVIVNQIVIEQPQLVVVSKPSESQSGKGGSKAKPKTPVDQPGTAEASQDEAGFQPTVTIAEFRVENGSLVSRIEGQSPSETTITGLNLQLGDFHLDSAVADPILGLSAKGSIQVEQISAGDLVIKGSRGRISIDRGRVSITEFGVDTDNASLEIAALELDLKQQPPPFTLQAGGECDLNSLMKAKGDDAFGPASLQMSLIGSGPDLNQIAGDGTLRLETGEIPAFPMVSLIERILGEPLITGNQYQATEIQFTVADGKIQVQPFMLALENMQISGVGEIDLAGPLDMEIAVRLPREQVHIDSLEGAIDGLTEDGWTTLPFNVEGSMGEPDVGIDSSLYKDAAKGMGKKAVGGLLDKVFDKDDSN
jgi:hypothetical protein